MKKICKKIIPIFIIAMFFLSFMSIEYATETNLKIGDINGDGEVNTLDRILLSQHIAASRVPEIAKEQPTWVLKEEKIKAGDINGDGEINPLDRMRVSEYIAATRVPEIAKENPTWKTYIESKWEVEATGITLNTTTLSIEKGKVSKLTATIQPSNVTNKIVTWSSSDTKVATVDGIGNVTAKDIGISIITATTKSGKSAKCEVKVTQEVKNISTLNTTLSTTSVTYNGKAQTPAVTVKDGNTVLKNGTNYTVAYSKNTNVGTATATVTGKGNYVGTTTKTFKINKASYNINSIRFANSTITYDGKAHSITATGIPAGVTATYTGNGKINAGTYTITAKFTGNATNYNTIANKTAVLRINPKPVTTLSITGITDKTYTGKAIMQSVVVKYGSTTLRNGTDYTIGYRNNVNVGTASVIITGKGNYSGTVTKTFRIKEITPTSITLNNTSLTIENGNTKNLTATVYPSNAVNKKVNWYSSNTNVATINSTGKVTAKSAGTCYVTAVTVNSKVATCKITVKGDQFMNPGAPLNVKTGFSKESYNGLQYYKCIPDNPTEKMALIVFLHGDGEQNKMNKLGNLDIVKYVKSKEPYKAGKFVFIAPLRTTKHWASGSTLQKLMKLIDKTANDYKVDKNRIILTGMSSGGNGTWNIACKYQNYFAAIMPMSAKTAGASAKKLTNIPIWGICGNTTSDEKERNRQMTKLINEINKKNGKKLARLETIQSARHGTIQKYYKRIEVFKWMLSQKRN